MESSGLSRSNCERGILPNKSSAGGTPVVEWGVNLYQNRNLESLVLSDSAQEDFFIFSKLCTALSAKPLLAG